MKSVKSALLVKDWETRYVSNQGGCAMHLHISEEDDNPLKTHIMLADEIALYDFLKALVALENQVLEGYAEVYDEELDNHRVFVRYLTYRIDFPPSGHLEKKQRRLETLLLKSFFDLFWSGFRYVTITGARDEGQQDRLLESVRKDRWSTVEECIDVLQNLNLAGRLAYQKGDYYAAHKHWEHAEYTWNTTMWTDQAQEANIFEEPTVVAPMSNVLFQLRSNLAAVFLKFANDPHLASEVLENRFQLDCQKGYRCCLQPSDFCLESKMHENQLRFAAVAHEYCTFAGNLVKRWQPTNIQLSNLHYRRAQALRLRGCLRGNLQAAGVAIQEAIRLCPVDAALPAEWQKITDGMRAEIKSGTSKALEVKEVHAGEEREWAFSVTAG